MPVTAGPREGPTDHLAALVDRAVGGADDPTADRLRRAMGGESPARFLGRLVLERAAHLVRETDRTLQDIAVDCGFRGYDVFARAFRRELGALPSQWRASPTSYVIDAPGEVHFQPPDGLRLPARSRMDGTDLVVDLVGRHVRAVEELLESATRLGDAHPDSHPDSHPDPHPAPHPDPRPDGSTLPSAPSALSALSELVGRMERLTALARETAADPTGAGTLPALRERLDVVGPDLVDVVARLGATGRFDEAFVDAFSPEPTAVTLGDLVTAMVTDADGLLRSARERLAGAGSR